jgi:hypothetical protein
MARGHSEDGGRAKSADCINTSLPSEIVTAFTIGRIRVSCNLEIVKEPQNRAFAVTFYGFRIGL